ncbi:MAG: hypothetical protein KDA55_00115, partial [Planctomycetales bacterium]|nr:hypothetical protein [Planctomycetales bacterium]
PSWLLAPSVRAGQRWALDGESVSEQRISIGLEVGVPRLRGVRVGLLGAIGTSTAIDRAGFKGTWREWNVMVSTSKAIDVRAWRLWAQAAAGVSRATLDGEQNRVTRTERATQAAGALFVGGGRRVGLFTVGAVLAAEARGASRYARDNNQPLWDEPGLWLSALAALELSL